MSLINGLFIVLITMLSVLVFVQSEIQDALNNEIKDLDKDLKAFKCDKKHCECGEPKVTKSSGCVFKDLQIHCEVGKCKIC